MYHFSFFTYLCLFLRLPDQKGVGHPDNALSVQLCWTDVHHALHSPQRYPPQSRNAGKADTENLFTLLYAYVYVSLHVFAYFYAIPEQKNALQASGRSRITGKGNETIEKTRKKFPIPTLPAFRLWGGYRCGLCRA